MRDADFTPGQLRTQYSEHGYQVEAPIRWWTTDQVTSLRVFDTRTDRVVMVLVYPDSGVADAERAKAQAHEATGSHLVPGYGLSLRFNHDQLPSHRMNGRFCDGLVG